jgi:Sec-independent protein translocase protein TatA
MPDTGILGVKDLIQINATMIVGILIFYTIPFITKEGRVSTYDKIVVYAVAGTITLFAVSSVSAIVSVVPVSEWCTVGGFIVVIVLVFASTKVIKIAKDEIKGFLQVEFEPKTGEQTQEEEEKRKTEEQHKTTNESEGYEVIRQPGKDEDSSDKSAIRTWRR